ncbi:uncharacterized protein LOC141597554 [Silene latifolia]|uniref:uncharacterized protein LOC141597554 n=1 Tax=Silene latifolia TaxID=37657 RepID=UPI003D778910
MGLSSKQVSSDGNNGWNQTLLESAKTLEFPKTFPMKRQQQQQQQPEQLNCPRCDSTNTKFCYYNNYNKSQPRHFCKACKRHWTKGGTLRNVPVGGGRKNKRLKTSKNVSKTNITTTTTTTPLIPNNNLLQAVSNSRVSCNDNISKGFYQQPCILPNTSTITFTSKGLNDEILLSTTETTSLGLSSQNHDYDQEIQLPYSNLGNFESNPCSISSTITSIQSPILYNFTNDHQNNGGLEETMMNNDHDDHQPWTSSMHTTSSNNWSWDDFDKFVSVEDDLTMPWDDIDIKP